MSGDAALARIIFNTVSDLFESVYPESLSAFEGLQVGITTSQAPPRWIDEIIHTATMTLKNSAFLALVGVFLLTVLLALDFAKTVSGVLDGIVPSMTLLRSLVYLLASLGVTAFFYAFSRRES